MDLIPWPWVECFIFVPCEDVFRHLIGQRCSLNCRCYRMLFALFRRPECVCVLNLLLSHVSIRPLKTPLPESRVGRHVIFCVRSLPKFPVPRIRPEYGEHQHQNNLSITFYPQQQPKTSSSLLRRTGKHQRRVLPLLPASPPPPPPR